MGDGVGVLTGESVKDSLMNEDLGEGDGERFQELFLEFSGDNVSDLEVLEGDGLGDDQSMD